MQIKCPHHYFSQCSLLKMGFREFQELSDCCYFVNFVDSLQVEIIEIYQCVCM